MKSKSIMIENPDRAKFNGNNYYYYDAQTYPFGYLDAGILKKFESDFKDIIVEYNKYDSEDWLDDEDMFMSFVNLCTKLKHDVIRFKKEPIKSSDVFMIEDGNTHSNFDFGIDKEIWSFVLSTQDILGRDLLKRAGRIFKTPKLISFWNHPNKHEIITIIHDIESKLSNIKINSDWYIEIYENGIPKQISVNEYIGSDALSSEELSKKHVMSPSEKEKLGIKNNVKGFGSDKQSDISQKAGFTNYAEFNNMRQTSESLIKENPDDVRDENRILTFTSIGSIPFGYYDDKLLKNYLKVYDKLYDELSKSTINEKEVSILKIELFDCLQDIKETINSNSYERLNSSDELYMGLPNEIHATMYDLPFDPMSNEIRLIRKKLKIITRQLLKFTGRIWKYDQIISFWTLPDKSTLSKIIHDFKFIYNIDMDTPLWRIELSNGSLVPITEYSNSTTTINKDFKREHLMSPTEKYRQHANDHDTNGFGTDKQSKRAEKSGFKTYAEYDAYRKTSESTIKLSSLIKENPDSIEFDDIPYVKWTDNGAYPFGYYKTHLLDEYIASYDKWSDDSTDISNSKKELDISVKNLEEELKKMQTEPINSDDIFYTGKERSVHPEFKLPIEFSSNYIITLRKDYHINYKNLIKYPGRIWLKEKIISFWYYPSESVLKRVLDDLKKSLNIDFNADNWQVELKPSSYDSELLPLNKYYKGHERSSYDLETPHVMSPSEKEKHGFKNNTIGFGTDKQSDIAQRAGFTNYAQFNNTRGTSESVIKLRYLIKEDPDTVYLDNGEYIHLSVKGAYPFAYYKERALNKYIELYNKFNSADTDESYHRLQTEVNEFLKNIFDECKSQGDTLLPDDIMYIGKESEFHDSIDVPLENNDNRSAFLYYYDQRNINHAKNVNMIFCPGRIWTVQKIISFYNFPAKSSFKKILNDLHNNFNVDFSDPEWKVDLRTGTSDGKLLSLDEYYPVKNYTDKEMYQMHLLSPTEKEKMNIVKKNDGYGSVKQGAISSKSGFNNYAQYNASRSTSENKIKLKDLLS